MKLSIQNTAELYLDTRSDSAFKELYDRLYPNLRSYTRKFLINYKVASLDDLVEEIISRVFEKVIVNLEQYNKLWNFSTWVYAICKNELILEKKRIVKFTSIDYSNFDDDFDSMAMVYTKCIDVDHVMVENKSLEEVETEAEMAELYDLALTEMLMLPDSYRDILIDREIHDMSYAELSIKYELHIGTIKSRIRIGRIKVKDSMISKRGKITI